LVVIKVIKLFCPRCDESQNSDSQPYNQGFIMEEV